MIPEAWRPIGSRSERVIRVATGSNPEAKRRAAGTPALIAHDEQMILIEGRGVACVSLVHDGIGAIPLEGNGWLVPRFHGEGVDGIERGRVRDLDVIIHPTQ